jgi:hypothetical protein
MPAATTPGGEQRAAQARPAPPSRPAQAAQRVGERGHRGPTPRRIEVEAAAEQRLQSPWHPRVDRQRDRGVGHRRGGLHALGSRTTAVQRLEQACTQRELIGRRPRREALELLGGHVRRRAGQAHALGGALGGRRRRRRVLGRRRPSTRPCEPEIHQAHAALAVDHHVLGLDVAVDQTRGVGRREAGGRLLEHAEQRVEIALGPLSPLADPRAQGLALDVFHRQVHLAVVLADLEHRDHVGVTQARQRHRLATQHVPRAARPRVAQHLDRDHAIERGVPGREHQAHAAAADRPQHVVLGDERRLDPGEHLPAQPRQAHRCVERLRAGPGRRCRLGRLGHHSRGVQRGKRRGAAPGSLAARLDVCISVRGGAALTDRSGPARPAAVRCTAVVGAACSPRHSGKRSDRPTWTRGWWCPPCRSVRRRRRARSG